MLDLHLGARVACADGDGGTMGVVIVDRAAGRVTHLVVKETGLGGLERLVPVARVAGADEGLVRLGCTRAELGAMAPFTVPEMIEDERGMMEPAAMAWMGSNPEAAPIGVFEVEQIPEGGVAVRRGMPVEATDGPVGRLDDLLVDPATDRITHFSVREGHVHQRDLTLPLAAVARVAAGTVHLTLARAAVAALPVVPARRLFGRGALTRAAPTEIALFAFPAAEAAGGALRAIRALEGAGGRAITVGVVLTKDRDGSMRTPSSAGEAARSAPLLAALADRLSGRSGDPLLAEYGPTEAQLGAMRDAIAPGGSALLAAIDVHIWTAALEEVARLQGALVRHAPLDAVVHRLAGDAGPSPRA
jgi:hypothetical protein